MGANDCGDQCGADWVRTCEAADKSLLMLQLGVSRSHLEVIADEAFDFHMRNHWTNLSLATMSLAEEFHKLPRPDYISCETFKASIVGFQSCKLDVTLRWSLRIVKSRLKNKLILLLVTSLLVIFIIMLMTFGTSASERGWVVTSSSLLRWLLHTMLVWGSHLLEVAEHVSEGGMELFKETIQDVIKISQGLSKKSLIVKAELNGDEEELLEQNQSKKAVENTRKAENYTVGKWISAGAGLVTGVAAVPASASSMLAVTAAAVCPVTLCLGFGAALFCGGMAVLCNNAAESHSQCADVAKEMAGLTNQMAQAVEMNQRLWTGVCMASTELCGHVMSCGCLG